MLWIVMTISPVATFFLFSTRIGFFTGYLLIASIIGLAIDAYYRRVHRALLPISISVITIGLSVYYYNYYREQTLIKKLESEIQFKNEISIKVAKEYIRQNSINPVPLQTQYQQFSRYTLNHYYSNVRFESDKSIKYSENFYIKENYCRNIFNKNEFIEFKSTEIRDGGTESGKICYLRTKIKNPHTMISYSREKREKIDSNEMEFIIYLERWDILIDSESIGSYLSASVESLPVVPWPIVICGNFGGFAPIPERFCSVSLRSFIGQELETRPDDAIKAGVSDIIAMILDLKPRKFLYFPEHEMSPVAKQALSAYLTSEAKSELLDSTQNP
ncbi:hypothetical protein [Breoghania sp. L-A4]|uniref:hypothetical protein n=1 Tax=Breoghania sp. L-A4 TaxID=2304600 RepID=UPI0013C2BDC3|nr:hypothetical protein [Breoghania sp. L-A4]